MCSKTMLIILIMVGVAVAADSVFVGSWMEDKQLVSEWKRDSVSALYTADGIPVVGVRGQKMEPIEIIDTVRMAGQYKTLELNEYRARKRVRVAGSSENTIRVRAITPIVEDSTKSAGYYTVQINRELNSITITSSNANDSSLLQVSLVIQ